ncbi:bifunctional oligoribonuclease/PAP phosphatase NrnA [Paracrocinitomix mangrovi]|uniref:DHH family phosphoesterase n=1 Tax=Paracrocinitomix mangrovi TaxID=2862509 RepID=UPI001C8EA638|nr:bifunctional oligoribonuclease/PAP phosphatase NrnA [Paracrocinitomix mangrovi]UKN01888.1 bifunctional oligoribonuclease/PAP phosphatase NrnA [Paracrocinitomix mangrovi]
MGIDSNKIQSLKDLLNQSANILITAHKSPDGDSVGSSLGLYHYLKVKGYNVNICHPDVAPDFLHWLIGHDEIYNLDDHKEKVTEIFANADLIFCLDYNSSSRIGQMEKLMNDATAKKVMVDHHRDPDENFCDLMFSDITSCSTSQLIYEIIAASGDENIVDPLIGTPLYAGIVTDTGSFRFSSTLPKTHLIAARLMEAGVRHWEVHEHIFDNNSLDRIRLVSYAMLNKLVILPEYKAAHISLGAKELESFNATKGDTEGLVNQALGIEGVKMAVFFKEDDGIVKISFRSKGAVPVSEMAKNHFNGGGHLNASGGKFVGKIEDAIDKFVTILPRFVDENKACFDD